MEQKRALHATGHTEKISASFSFSFYDDACDEQHERGKKKFYVLFQLARNQKRKRDDTR